MSAHDPLDYARTMQPDVGRGIPASPSSAGNHAATLADGTTLGQYKVVRLLGRGGMGEVYEVEHAVLCRRYALKLLPTDFASRPGALERFKREAMAMANLDHPNIVRVDEFGETGGRHWLRMELAEGGAVADRHVRSLAEYAEASGGRLDPDQAEAIFGEILEGLAYAHQHGVVHRDLKPSNILIFSDAEGNATFKIADFGLVRMVGEEWMRDRADQSMRLSMSLGQMPADISSGAGSSTRSLIGTYEYMSPEQKRGEEATPASDVYAVGLIMYRLLTGLVQLGRKGASELVPGLAKAWDEVIDRAVEEDAAERYPDAGTMLAALPGRADSAPLRSLVASDRPPAKPSKQDTNPPNARSEQVASDVPPAQPSKRRPPAPAPSMPAASLAILDIASEPAGAEVLVDGGRWKGITPCTFEKFPPGEHHYRAVFEGEKLSGIFAVDGYEHTLALHFEEKLARREAEAMAKATAKAADLKRAGEVLSADLGSGISIELVYVPAGTFMMGADKDEAASPVHEVRISRGYWMGKFPVTQAQYEALSRWNPSQFKKEVVVKAGFLGFGREVGKRSLGDHPIESVFWDCCQDFCRRLTERERKAGRLPDGYVYRLPTEAEWEYAARGGSQSRGFTYAGSNNVDEVAWYGDNSGGKTHPVGGKKPNELGLYDMSGNVWEWCHDWYGNYPSGAVTDPSGPGAGSSRVSRGGGWPYGASYCRSARRSSDTPTYANGFLGFRVSLGPSL